MKRAIREGIAEAMAIAETLGMTRVWPEERGGRQSAGRWESIGEC